MQLDDAALLLAELQAAGPSDSTAPGLGDRFMLQNYYLQKSELDIRKLLGTGFSKAVMQLKEEKWHGPVLSGYSTHLVYVYALKQAPLPLLEDVRNVVLQNWQMDQQENFNEQFFDSLKSRYDIVIDKLPADRHAVHRECACIHNSFRGACGLKRTLPFFDILPTPRPKNLKCPYLQEG